MSNIPKTVRLSDYQPYPYRLLTTELSFDIQEGSTVVESRLSLERSDPSTSDIFLDGRDLELLRLRVNGRELGGNEYQIDEDGMTIFGVEDMFELEISTRIYPEKNTRLMGLYKSGGMYCTQCEAEGFRRMTFYPDRPDVQSVFTTHIEADASRYPILLSNGNPMQTEELGNGRLRKSWHDPFHKPSYLFAAVAGDLDHLESYFVTHSGRRVALRIYTDTKHVSQCQHAMDALKAAMRWDEEVYGREYDLDTFMIVAIPDFNFGAMENKGLNVFNTMAVLACPDTAIDRAYERISGIVAHEYFHNWSGNRVTCRDWFQLSLKEGFTVFRDSQFSADMSSPSVKRVDDVHALRTLQFAEDAGPLAHPVRPEQYSAISNFYSPTVYIKGAEVVRMLHTILGVKRFRAATDQYFEIFDGSAATTEDFVRCMERVSHLDLNQFRHWYTQSGTPKLDVEETRNEKALTLRIAQSCPPTPGQLTKEPFHIPVAVGVIDQFGREVLGAEGKRNGYEAELETDVEHENPNEDGTIVLRVVAPVSTVRFKGVPSDSTVSFLRGFSAPVVVHYPQSTETRIHLALHDSDGYTKWDAAQSILNEVLKTDQREWGAAIALFEKLIEQALVAPEDGEAKALLNAAMSVPPPLSTLQLNPGQDIYSVVERTEELHLALAQNFLEEWRGLVEHNKAETDYRPGKEASARRALRGTAMTFVRIGSEKQETEQLFEWFVHSYRTADNLTDRIMAITQILELRYVSESKRQNILEEFYNDWQHEELVLLHWFRLQAACSRPGGLHRVQRLIEHSSFHMGNPNFVRNLLGTFTSSNPRGFHRPTGIGYRFIADRVLEIEGKNGHVASGLLTEMSKWHDFDEDRQRLMLAELRRVRQSAKSKEVMDKIDRSLENAPSS